MNKTTQIIFLALSLFIIAIGSFLFYKIPLNYKDNSYVLNVNNKNIDLIVADTEELKTLGLSNRSSLASSTGMFFVFNKEDKYGFWMKDMRFNIDIVWLNAFKRVIYIEKNVSPDTYPDVFFPPEDSLYALEFNAGFVDENNIAVGNILDIAKK